VLFVRNCNFTVTAFWLKYANISFSDTGYLSPQTKKRTRKLLSLFHQTTPFFKHRELKKTSFIPTRVFIRMFIVRTWLFFEVCNNTYTHTHTQPELLVYFRYVSVICRHLCHFLSQSDMRRILFLMFSWSEAMEVPVCTSIIQSQISFDTENALKLFNAQPYTKSYHNYFFFLALQPSAVYGLLVHEDSWSHTMTGHSQQDSSGIVISSSQKPLPDNKHNRQTSMPPLGFETTIVAGERP
jgi:hypothetical protein